LYDYWRFDHEKPVKFHKDDCILGVCKEMMDFMAYTEFSRLKKQTQADLVAIIIQHKKDDGKYIEFEQSYSYNDMYGEDED
jgi:hypothetical protein